MRQRQQAVLAQQQARHDADLQALRESMQSQHQAALEEQQAKEAAVKQQLKVLK